MSENVGWAALQIIPSARNFRKHLQDETSAPLAAFGNEVGDSVGGRIGDRIGAGIGRGVKDATPDVEKHISGGVDRGFRAGFRRGFRGLFSLAREQDNSFRRSLAFGIAGGIISGAKEGFGVAMDIARAFMKTASNALSSASDIVMSGISAAVMGAGTTAATGGLNLLIGALLAVAVAIPLVATGFVALAPVVLLAGGAFGSLFTLLVGGVGAVGVFALAFRGVGAALGEVMENGKATEETLKKLSPNARSFVSEFEKLRKPLSDLRNFVQDRFFDGLNVSLRELAGKWLPALKPMLGDLAGRFNGFAKNVIAALGDATFIENIREAMRGFGGFIDRLGESMKPLIATIGRLAKASVPFLTAIGDGIGGAIDKFAAWIETAEKSGALTRFMNDAAKSLRDIWAIGGLVIGIAGDIIEIFFPSSKRTSNFFLGGIKAMLTEIKDWLGDPENQKKIQEWIDKCADFAKKAATQWIPAAEHFFSTLEKWVNKLEGWGKDFDNFKNRISGAFDKIRSVADSSVRGVGIGLGLLAWPVSLAIDQFGRLRAGAASQFGNVVSAARQLPGRIVSALGNVNSLLWSSGSRVVSGLAGGIRNAAHDAASAASQLRGRVVSGVGYLGDVLSGTGWDLVAGLARGIRNAAWLAIAAARVLAASLPAWVRKVLDINSPSRVFMTLGEQVAAGMALGINNGAGAVTKAVTALTQIPDAATVNVGTVTGRGYAAALAGSAAITPAPVLLDGRQIAEVVFDVGGRDYGNGRKGF